MDAAVGDHVLLKGDAGAAIWQITKIDDPPQSGTVTGRFSSKVMNGAYSALVNSWRPTVHVTLVLPPSGWFWSDLPPVRCVHPLSVVPINEIEVFARIANWSPGKLVVFKPIANPRRILPPGGFVVRRQLVWRQQHRGAA